MKTYKYYVHGKPKTFDLTSLTPEEIEKFKNMNNTERLRFIELHHLENIPLWDQIDVKSSTKLTDEAETDRKNRQKYNDLYRAKNIKNQLEQMKKKGTEPTEENIKKAFNDFETQDILEAKKNGYVDIDSLINFYANKIETLNVDSIETLKAKEIKNLEAANIKLNDTKSLINAIEKVFPKESIKKITEGIEKGDIPESVGEAVISDDVLKTIEGLIKNGNTDLANSIKTYFDELIKAVEAKTGSTITKEDLNDILKTDELKKALVTEIKSEINKAKNKILGDTQNIIKSYDELKNIYNKIQRIEVKEFTKMEEVINFYKPILENLIDTYGTLGETEKWADKNDEEKITACKKDLETKFNNKQYFDIIRGYNDIVESTNMKYSYAKKIPIIKSILQTIDKNISDDFKDEYNEKIAPKKPIRPPAPSKKGKGVLTPNNWTDSEDSETEPKECGKFLNRFKDYSSDIERLNLKTIDLKGDILSLKGNVKDIYNVLKDVNSKLEKIDKAVSLGDKSLKEVKENPKSETKAKPAKEYSSLDQRDKDWKNEQRNQNFLNDIINKPSLKHVDKDKEKEPEKSDLMKVMEQRRKDIEPDEYDEGSEDEDWGEGMTNKVIKFKALMKLLN